LLDAYVVCNKITGILTNAGPKQDMNSIPIILFYIFLYVLNL
ncbi:hypothetical protein UYO_3095, partial [Lachnospiraceae bacterium JC7]